jgi:uncharacterized protein YjbI with pentapeptide repeats
MPTEPDDLGPLQNALNDAAGKASSLWITFITFELYLIIAFGSVTHRDLLLETPVRLPILNVELPLVGFFVVAPTILVIFHFYIMLQIFVLSSRAAVFGILLSLQFPIASDRQYIRQRLDPFLILQFLAGPKEQRRSSIGLSLQLVTWITLVGLPILILLFAQVTFLPFHLSWVTWLHRTALLIDLMLTWILWQRIQRTTLETASLKLSFVRAAVGLTSAVILMMFSVCVATYPGEWTDNNVPSIPIIPTKWKFRWDDKADWISLHALLFLGEADEITGKPRSLLSNRLILTNQIFVDREKLATTETSRQLRGRDLRGAIFVGTDLRKIDFTGSTLEEADFSNAKLQQARFDCASVGVEDTQSIFKGMKEVCSDLRGAKFDYAELTGASFRKVNIQGARFYSAMMYGSRFWLCHGQGAMFNRADANFQGASFFDANLAGADLQGSDFTAARLDGAYLQGVQIGNNNTFNTVYVSTANTYRLFASDNNYKVSDLFFERFEFDPVLWVRGTGYHDFERFISALEVEIHADESIGKRVIGRMSVLGPSVANELLKSAKNDVVQLTQKVKSQSLSREEYGRKLANELYYLVCFNDSPRYVIEGMLRSGVLRNAGAEIPRLAARWREAKQKLELGLKADSDCKGGGALPDQLIFEVEALAGRR